CPNQSARLGPFSCSSSEGSVVVVLVLDVFIVHAPVVVQVHAGVVHVFRVDDVLTAPLADVVVLDGGLVPSVSPAGAAQILVVGDRVNQVVGHGFLLLPSRYCLLYQQRGRERNPNTKTAPKPTLRAL